ncbi:hypothetical protein BGX29_008446 [Mortierella sp. GBA35]|nr:hypothetical protein BGX23_002790 [Mortierella sp. AD031]KAF9096757.1 hypothetical protein BGX29_008446 [Mortierella sp. GBA35]KAG0208348.1 hypothetical protein BGX33_006321 [Mortierella sp. NVP41]
MRFSTSILVTLLAAVCATTYAQTQTPPMPSAACQECLSKAGAAQVPSCTGSNAWPTGDLAVEKLTPEQKNCYCQLSSNNAWVKSCAGTGPEQCEAAVVQAFSEGLVLVKNTVCPASKSAAGLRLVDGSNAKVAAGMTAAAAAVSALLF